MAIPKDKIKKQQEANEKLKKVIASLSAINPDKSKKISFLPKPKKRETKSTSSAIKEFGDIFAKDNSEVDYNSDPGLRGAYDMPGVYDFETNPMSGWKKGGRLKKAKKKASRKRAALRGQRSELRGS